MKKFILFFSSAIFWMAGCSTDTISIPSIAKEGNEEFKFNYNTEGAPADTITLHYTATPMFANMDCGAMYGFNISAHQFTRHAIDSVALVKPEVTNNNAVTLRIFMR